MSLGDNGQKKGTKVARRVCEGLSCALLAAAFFYLLEAYTHNPFLEVRPMAQLFNVLLFELALLLLALLTGRLRLPLCILGAASMLFGLLNAYVVRFRTNPLVPWDFLSWRTALSVAGGYDFAPDARMVAVTAAFLLLIALIAASPRICTAISARFRRSGHGGHREGDGGAEGEKGRRAGRIPILLRLIGAAAVIITLALYGKLLQQEQFQNLCGLYNKLFTPVYMTEVDGIPVTFVMNLAYMAVDRPAGYDRQEAEDILSSYGSANGVAADEGGGSAEDDAGADGVAAGDGGVEDDAGADGGDGADGGLPNIIVVMNESFSDLAVLGELETNQDYMPVVHGLQQGGGNAVTGMLHVSVCGGNTANTEFEFLTGNTMAFLPPGSVPYQQYLDGPRPSLASHLKSLGYQTIATHPYYASGWDRDEVYPWLGFDESIFLGGYPYSLGRVRDYVSDEACVKKIIDLYEDKEEGRPLFVFNVTMQNHGGYDEEYDNFSPDVFAEGIESESVSQYLSLVRLSDAALGDLISYFSKEDERTVILFFGDHQPSDAVAAPILAKNGMRWNALTDEQAALRYEVPYVIWANYGIEGKSGADISANYLGERLLSCAGVPAYGYWNFLAELERECPVISAAEPPGPDGEGGDISTYRKLQYYEIFDYEE